VLPAVEEDSAGFHASARR